MSPVRPPVLAGTWYPADPERLRARVREYLAAADPARRPPGRPTVVLSPHAGYRYSGPTAGKVLGLLRGLEFRAVFILAPSHRAHLVRPALPAATGFATPLGTVPVAGEIVARLAATGDFTVDEAAHRDEHAVEIQLPLLQEALPAGTPIVPILVPPLAPELRRAAARALDPYRDGDHLLLVSSDLTHYGRAYGYVPFTEHVGERLEELDTGALLRILAHDSEGLLRYGQQTGITMCGLEAAALALDSREPGPHHAELVDYTRSADGDGDPDLSVSYAGVLICRDPAIAGLSDADRRFLLTLARRCLEAAVRGEPAPTPAALAAELGQELSPALNERRGAFVTLRSGGLLRGCIGYIEGHAPLAEAVAANARSAALDDPRFPPVRPQELAGLHIEVSALTRLRPVAGPEAITVGRHGVLLEKAGRRAVFLPQVAPELGWDLPTMLGELALKAGLGPDDWRSGCRFQVFEAEICEE
ncbi:MAG: AmmeMemoRadiSam system protein B [Candidatus Krumholzibacteriia bacterium]